MLSNYQKHGYCLQKEAFTISELQPLKAIITRFHRSWIQTHAEFYADKAVNSAYLTGQQHLSESDRTLLFRWIAADPLMDIVTTIMGKSVAFMNTQLFFDPSHVEQPNYWHRDPQYHMSIEEQQAALLGPNVLHFRVPLVDEPGIELIPGTHRRWDTQEELAIRLEQDNHKNHEAISTGVEVPLNAGDVLVFNANMIHRGLYGMNRFALDILFCDPVPDLMAFVDDACLPTTDILRQLDHPIAFKNTLSAKAAGPVSP